MRWSRSFVSGFDTSGDFGPPPSPCCGPHGAGPTGRCVLSGMRGHYGARPKKARPARRARNCRRNVRGACQSRTKMRDSFSMRRFFLAARRRWALIVSRPPAMRTRKTPLRAGTPRTAPGDVQQQSKQIEALAEQIARLTRALEDAESAGAAAASGDPRVEPRQARASAAPKAECVPKAEAVPAAPSTSW